MKVPYEEPEIAVCIRKIVCRYILHIIQTLYDFVVVDFHRLGIIKTIIAIVIILTMNIYVIYID